MMEVEAYVVDELLLEEIIHTHTHTHTHIHTYTHMHTCTYRIHTHIIRTHKLVPRLFGAEKAMGGGD